MGRKKLYDYDRIAQFTTAGLRTGEIAKRMGIKECVVRRIKKVLLDSGEMFARSAPARYQPACAGPVTVSVIEAVPVPDWVPDTLALSYRAFCCTRGAEYAASYVRGRMAAS